MEFTGDELAGVVDLFDALTRAELAEALVELAYKQGDDRDPSSFAEPIDDALASYHLVAVPDADPEADGPLLVAGPLAFPALPEGATDLPHIMTVPERSVARADAGRAAAERFRADAAGAVDDGDAERMRELLDASYELEAWAPVDLADARERLDGALG
ncbi:MAG: hypothetical protein ABEJ30_01970 [Halorientalis sp.]